MGSNDIFMSEFKNGKWTRPVNLGYPVNSIEYDGFVSMSEDKKTGHYSTLRADGLGSADIYKVTFLPPKAEKPVLLASNEPQVQPVVVEQPKVVEPVVTTPPPPVSPPKGPEPPPTLPLLSPPHRCT